MADPQFPRFLQIHSLHAYPGVLLNRDDSGLAKRLPFGGATRTRVSSQCLKRHWRTADDEWALAAIGVPMGKRSRHIVDRAILGALVREGIDQPIAEAVAEVFLKQLFQESAKRAKAAKAEEATFEATTGQAVLFGKPEIDYLLDAARTCCTGAADAKAAQAAAEAFFKDRDIRANLAAMKHHAGLEAALFGRMVTSNLVANTDASIHVAHAFTVHAEESESDYFTVVDDLRGPEEGDDAGAAGIFDMELTSGLFYGYVVVDVPALVSNLEGPGDWRALDRTLAGRVVEHLLHLIAKVSPGAKLGSTAPYGWAELMLVEAGSRQPRSLANAFRDAVPLRSRGEDGSLLARTAERLGSHIGRLDDCYGAAEIRRFASPHEVTIPAAERLAFNALAAWAGGTVTAVAPGA